ncbi:hypothetical protein UCMB321_3675 [Pseudomonas batumici]|uniref:Uncharacterized protein n=1 Tax=Pseudomonas batumici TaxID=226910 RepID=A0A0C2I6L0_9PSED|nr:hypothetical protein UCMB321_3675 [Pseudomonas batumici]
MLSVGAPGNLYLYEYTARGCDLAGGASACSAGTREIMDKSDQ